MSSFRAPQTLSTSPRQEAAASALEAELHSERAAALGRTGRDVEKALARLNILDAGDPTRPIALQAAADAAWRYFVQREACGLLNHDQAIKDYAIPPEVLARVGAFER